MHINKQSIFQFLAGIAGIGMAFAAGYILRDVFPAPYADFALFDEAYNIVADHGLKPLPEENAIEHGMIRGMLEAYDDPYSMFIEPAQTELQSNSLHGSFGGIGVRFGEDFDGFWVLYPYPDSPAAAAGILEGDRLISADDLNVELGTPLDTISAAIRGPVGETITLVIARPPDYTQFTYEIKRAEIPLPSVTWHLDTGEQRLGIIEVNIIADSTTDEILKAAKDLQSRGATHFLLDLRNNGGGLLQSGISVARLFLKDGDVMQQQYRGQEVETFHVDKPGELSEIPLVVLVNENTASAAEIIAGALQAQERAELIGRITYGKNTVQLVFSLSDRSSIHVTAANWWIPGLEFPRDGHGLTPDIQLGEDQIEPQFAVQQAISYFFGE